MAATKTAVLGLQPAKIGINDYLLDNSYVAGGYALPPGDFGMSGIFHAVCSITPTTNKLAAEYDPTTGKMKVFYTTGGSAASPAAVAQPAVAAPGAGTFAVTTTPDAGATQLTGSAAKPALAGVLSGALAAPASNPGAGKEVLAATDLSAFTVRVTAFGV